MEEKKKKEITVRAPSKPVTPPEKKAESDLEKSLEAERFGVSQVSRRVGVYFSLSVLMSGVLLLCLLTIIMVSGQAGWLVISSEITFVGFVIWIFVGIANVIGGLFLIGSE